MGLGTPCPRTDRMRLTACTQLVFATDFQAALLESPAQTHKHGKVQNSRCNKNHPPEKYVSARERFSFCNICMQTTSPFQLAHARHTPLCSGSAPSQPPSHYLHTALQRSGVSKARFGAGSKSRKQNTILQGLLNLCSHNIWATSESFTSIHARCSALFVASWEAQKTIAGGGRSIPVPCPSLSLRCHN